MAFNLKGRSFLTLLDYAEFLVQGKREAVARRRASLQKAENQAGLAQTLLGGLQIQANCVRHRAIH